MGWVDTGVGEIMTPPSAPGRTVSRTKLGLSVIITVVSGALAALQARINGQLGSELGDGFLAALISFGSGLVILSVVIVLVPSGRRNLARVVSGVRGRVVPWWFLAGGLAGGLFVLTQGITAAIIGIALFTVAAVTGQTLGGLAIDARGIGTVAPKVITPRRVIGTVLALVAVGIAVGPQLHGSAPFWMLLMPFLAGLLLGWQQAVNGQVKTFAQSALVATFINFAGGTVLLVVFALIHAALVGWPRQAPSDPLLYIGGSIGIILVAVSATVIPIIGVLVQSLAAVAGQLLMSLVLDIVAPTDAVGLVWTTVVGTALTLVAVVIASVPARAGARGR
jgi:transporter family-2 protein